MLCQLIRGAELLLVQRGEKASGACTVAVPSLCFWKLVILSLTTLSLLLSLTFFFFYCPVFFHSHPVSAGFLPLFKHSLSSFSVSLSDFVKPLVSPCPPSFHPLHRRSALYLSDRLAWAHHSLGIAACPLTED